MIGTVGMLWDLQLAWGIVPSEGVVEKKPLVHSLRMKCGRVVLEPGLWKKGSLRELVNK